LSDKLTREQLLESLRADRDQWEALLTEIGGDQMTTPGVVGDWTVKDVLGHLTANIRANGASVRAVVTGIPPAYMDLFDTEDIPEGAYDWSQDQINESIRALYAPHSLEVVLEKWRWAFGQVVSGIEQISEDDLFTPGRSDWAAGRSLAVATLSGTINHDSEHYAQVRAWADELPN
jgi:hypothetical protein